MAAGALNLYAINLAKLNADDLLGVTVKMALVTNAYTPNYGSAGDDVWADVSGSEIANGNGYTTGGVTLGSKAATAITNGWRFNSANAVWNATGSGIATFRRAVLYVSGSLWGLTNPLIGSLLGDETPANIPLTPAGAALTIICPSGGWFDIVKTP